MSKAAVDGLLDIGRYWSRIPGLDVQTKDFQLTDELINNQLMSLGTSKKIEKVDSQALADAIAVAALSPT